MVKAHSSAVNSIKERLTGIKTECQSIIDELMTFKEALEVLQIEMKNGKLIEDGKKAKAA